MARILVIYQEPELRDLIAQALKGEGFEVVVAIDNAPGMKEFYRTQPDMVIAGENLSSIEGEAFCTRLRYASDVPLIIIGAKQGELALVRMLEMGADVYLYPVNLKELLVRVRSLLRRRKTNHNLEEQCFAELTPTEAILLACLALNWDRVITTPGLITEVWGGKKVTQNSLKLYIHRLRRKLDGRFHLINCPGVGYRLIQPIPDQVEELAGSPTPLSEGARQSQAEVKGLWD